MPWTASDSTKYTKKAKTDKLKGMWAATANGVREKCIKDGGSEKECDARAIKQANGVIANQVQENEMDNGSEWTMASVAQTAIEVGLAVARETDEIANDEAAKTLDLLRSKWNELGETSAPIVSIADVEVDGERVLLSDIVEFYRVGKAAEKEEEVTATEEPKDKMPSVEHLKLYAIEAIDVIRNYFDALDIPLEEQEPDTECKDNASDVEVTIDADAPAIEEPLIEFDEGDDVETTRFETDGHALLIAEDVEGESRAAPLKLNFVVIEPGFGNKKMKRYYPASMLQESAAKFKGTKMYTTNHKAGEKNARDTEVGVVLECPVGFTETGGIIAQAGIWDAAFARNIRNRAELGALNTLENSVLGEGTMRKGKVNGKQAYIVESLDEIESVDWVTKAGAGGRALEIVENDEEGGSNMTEGSVDDVVEEVVEEQVTETEVVEETDPSQDVVETEGEVLEEAMIAEAVAEEIDKTSLPEAFKVALKVREYANADELAGAITQATDDYKAATGSGKPFGQGQAKQGRGAAVAESDETLMERKAKRLDRIYAEAGIQS